MVADRNNDAVLVYDTTTLAHIATIGVVGVAVPLDNIHLNQPSGVCVDATNDHILAVDGGDERVQIYDAKSLAYVATIGEPNVAGIDNAHFGRPVSVKINPVSGQSYVATLGIQPSDAEYNPLTNQIMIADPIWRGRCARHGRSRRSLEPSAASHGAVVDLYRHVDLGALRFH